MTSPISPTSPTSPTSITGYKAGATYWCPPCAQENRKPGVELPPPRDAPDAMNAPDAMKHGGSPILTVFTAFPVFAGAEFDSVPTCNTCGQTLEGYRLTQDGVTALARSMTKRREAAGVSIMDFAQALWSDQTGEQGASLTLEESLRELVRNPETLAMLHHWITGTKGGKYQIVGGNLVPFRDYAAHAAAQKHDPEHRCAVCVMGGQHEDEENAG